tara:strand:- start:226900 stop:227748 length:849 start_codon:yes stop_codon:yes gene_type:complete
MSSRDVVNVVQRRLRSHRETKKVKVGHCGTLDPLAEGVLMLAVGSASRLVPYIQQQPKRYLGRFRLGQSSPTGDLEMEVTHHDELPIPTLAQLQEQATCMLGQIQQTPPAYSAVWVNGKRAYDRVRGGEDVDMPSRTVTIDSLDIIAYDFPEIELDIVCGSGTYIRTLGMDLAAAVGSRAVMSYLQRVSIGSLRIEDAVSIDQLREDDLASLLRPANVAVTQLPKVVIDDEMSQRLGHGLCIDASPNPEPTTDDDVAAITRDGRLRAILRWKRQQWCPYRVF